MKRWLLVLLVSLMAGCDGGAAAGVTIGDAPGTAQFDQYVRDAGATETARAIALEVNIKNLQATDTQIAFINTSLATTATADFSMRATSTAVSATTTKVAEMKATEVRATEVSSDATATTAAGIKATQTWEVEATSTAIFLQGLADDARRKKIEADWMMALQIGGFVVGLVLCIIIIVALVRVMRKRMSHFRVGLNGQNSLMVLDNGNSQEVIDPMRMHGPVLSLDGQGGITAPMLAAMAEMQQQITVLAQYVLGQQAQHSPWKPVAPPGFVDRERRLKLGFYEMLDHTKPAVPPEAWSMAHPRELPAPVRASEQALLNAPSVALPEWEQFIRWHWQTNSLPIGMSEGILALDPEHDPHAMVAGTSGAGKTRHGLTVLAAGALRLGWQVVILNRAGADFQALSGHPHCHVFDGAEYPLIVLNAAAAEVDARNEVLRRSNVTTWSRLEDAPPRILIVIDELVALAQSMADKRQGVAVWRAVVHVTSAGRKCGVHLAFATTDPTSRTLGRLGLVARDNCARIAFRLRSNQAMMPGGAALDLGPRRFLALTSTGNAPVAGAAFSPSEDELRAFVEAIMPDAPLPFPLTLAAEPESDAEARVLELHERGVGVNEIQRQVFKTGPGGRDYYRVRDIISTAKNAVVTGENE